MIISKIIGGLGNQMFQYAIGRAISLKYDVPLRLDISGYNDHSLHNGFELKRVFNCPIQIATGNDMYGVTGWQSYPIIRQILGRSCFSTLRRNSFIVEPHFEFWAEVGQVPLNSYLIGFWQSERYFSECHLQIRNDFEFKMPLIFENANLCKQISQLNSVSLHIRRGDYITNPKTNSIHGLCSLDYYSAAIQYIVERVDAPHFFVFSDDPSWVKNNLKVEFPCIYVDKNNGFESYNDMHLMSLCKNNIIANSSFSWWSAWLNKDPNKIVIAPQRWFAEDTKVTNDLLPNSWIKL
jgi:hypothetical protein